jgi:class I fructose-bisphosphate aldolase
MLNPRLNRLFGANSRCVILSFDHGLFGEPSWLTGLEDMPAVIAEHAAVGPDGMTLPPGSAAILQALTSRDKPNLLLRADVTNAYLGARPTPMHAYGLVDAVQRAVRLDAVAVVAALLTYPGDSELARQCFANLDALRAQCEAVGMPLLVEILAMTDNHGIPLVQTAAADIAPLVRQAMELGADIIKADPTVPSGDFTKIIDAAAGIPVLASGGIKAPDAEVLWRTADLMEAGASGIAYGRNVMWAEHPARMTRALMHIVHDGMSAAQASASSGMDGSRVE